MMNKPTSPHLLCAADATPVPDHPRPSRVAPFGLLRMATLPYSRLDALRLPRTEMHIAALFAAEAEMACLRPSLEDALFALVSRLEADNVATRRAALHARRHIHAAGAAPLAGATVLLEALAGEERAALAAWCAAHERRRAAASAASDCFGDELQTVSRPALRAALAEPLFCDALTLASAGVAETAARERTLPRKPDPDNFERSLFGYLVRAAGKTSPFSTFMALTAVAVDPEARCAAPAVSDPAVQRRVRINRGVLARLARAAVRAAQRTGALPVRVNTTLAALGDDRYRALCERDVVFLGRPWREQRRAQFQLRPHVAQALLAAPDSDTHAALLARLCASGIDAGQADGLIDKLFERGVLLGTPLWDGFAADPEAALRRLLETQNNAAAPLFAEMVLRCSELAQAGHAQRAHVLAQIGDLERQLATQLGVAQEPPLRNVVLEDCWTSGVQGMLGSALLAPVKDLQGFLATQVEFSPDYLRLVDYFVAEYGAGGRCARLTDFLMKYGDRLIDPVEYGTRPLPQPTRRAMAHACLGVTAQVDIAIDAAQQPLMVVNKVYDRPGWLAARFAFGDAPGQAFLKTALSEWLCTVAGDCEPVDVLINGDCNDLQAHPRLTRRVLRWHGEALLDDGPDVLHPDELCVQHDPASGLLCVRDRANVPLCLLYLGSTMPTPSWGTAYALSILTQPYRLMRPPFAPPAGHDGEHSAQTDDVVFHPRRQRGQVVLARATWWVRADYLQRAWFSEQGAARSIAVERDCRRLGLPLRLFAQALPDPGPAGVIPPDALKGDRKPLWIDIRVPFCLSMLQRMAQRNQWIALTEMLPDAGSLWLDVKGERHVSEMQLELLVSADPASDPMTGTRLVPVERTKPA